MSLTEREKDIAIECFFELSTVDDFGVNHLYKADAEVFADLFLSRIRDEQEAVVTVLISDPEDERDGLSCTPKDWRKLCSLPAHTKLFTTPPAAPCDCSELVEALERIAANFGDRYTAQEALANHTKRMQSPTDSRGEE